MCVCVCVCVCVYVHAQAARLRLASENGNAGAPGIGAGPGGRGGAQHAGANRPGAAHARGAAAAGAGYAGAGAGREKRKRMLYHHPPYITSDPLQMTEADIGVVVQVRFETCVFVSMRVYTCVHKGRHWCGGAGACPSLVSMSEITRGCLQCAQPNIGVVALVRLHWRCVEKRLGVSYTCQLTVMACVRHCVLTYMYNHMYAHRAIIGEG